MTGVVSDGDGEHYRDDDVWAMRRATENEYVSTRAWREVTGWTVVVVALKKSSGDVATMI